MDREKIYSFLYSSADTIKSGKTFSEKMSIVYDSLDKAFPRVSDMAVLNGPITNLGDMMSRTEIEPLLKTVQLSAETSKHYCLTDEFLDSILQDVYKMAE